jgi:hypothetical protein
MTRVWQPNGSNAAYWRSDNPLIQGWWRFGDTPAPSWMTDGASAAYLSGMMVDSGPQKHYLKPSFTTQPTGTIFPVTGIAPWATSGSGIQFRWENSVRNQRRASLYVEPSTWHDENQNIGSNGHFNQISIHFQLLIRQEKFLVDGLALILQLGDYYGFKMPLVVGIRCKRLVLRMLL